MGKRRIIFFSVIIIFMILSFKAIFHYHVNPADDSFTNVKFCPACFGNTLCPQFFHGDISLLGASRLKSFQFINRKNVFTGKLRKERVILKKLAHDWEITEADKHLCSITKLGKSCDVSDAVKHLVKSYITSENRSSLMDVLKRFKSTTDSSRCPTERLLSYMFNKVNTDQRDYTMTKNLHMYKLGEMMYSLLVNPEAVMLQV